jgi:hypothetical protein
MRMTRTITAAALLAACACAGGCAPQRTASAHSPDWPNEPEGMTVVADWGFEQAPPSRGDVPIPDSPGWSVVYGTPSEPAFGSVRLSDDASAPHSPPHVYDVEYPKGMVEGTAPTTVYFPRSIEGLRGKISRAVSGDRAGLGWEAYVGFWWKPSSPFDLGPNGNKVGFLFNGGGEAGGQQFLILLPDTKLHVLPEYPGDFRWRHPNAGGTAVTLGAWHRVEWYANARTGALKWWLDGALQGQYDDVTNAHPFDVFKLSPTWGGNSGARKRQTDHYWFDHIRLSVR